jgi:hypothetical protein
VLIAVRGILLHSSRLTMEKEFVLKSVKTTTTDTVNLLQVVLRQPAILFYSKMNEITEIINEYNQLNNSSLTIDDISIDTDNNNLFVISDINGDLIRLNSKIIILDGLFFHCEESNQIIPIAYFVLNKVGYDFNVFYLQPLNDCKENDITDLSNIYWGLKEIEYRFFSLINEEIECIGKFELNYDKSWLDDFIYYRNKPHEIFDNIVFFKRTVKRTLSLIAFQNKLKNKTI